MQLRDPIVSPLLPCRICMFKPLSFRPLPRILQAERQRRQRRQRRGNGGIVCVQSNGPALGHSGAAAEWERVTSTSLAGIAHASALIVLLIYFVTF